MVDYSKIRVAAVKLLYASAISGSDEIFSETQNFELLFADIYDDLVRAKAILSNSSIFQANQCFPNYLKLLAISKDSLKLLNPPPSLEESLGKIPDELNAMVAAMLKNENLSLNTKDELHLASKFQTEIYTLTIKVDSRLRDYQKFVSNLTDKETPEEVGQLSRATKQVRSLLSKLQELGDTSLDSSKIHELKRIQNIRLRLQKSIKAACLVANDVTKKKNELDPLISSASENFDFERISKIDLSVLRFAIYEILHTDTPPKVAINEAIEISKYFGTTDSSRFVNGILDKISRLVSDG